MSGWRSLVNLADRLIARQRLLTDSIRSFDV
jgi:hypothetical protein